MKKMIDLLDLKVDVVFKDFFGDPSSKSILENFINTVLELKGNNQIAIEEFLDPRKMRVEVGKPTTFVDLCVKTKGGERYIIEMQTYNHEGFDRRLLYYLGKDYTEQIDYDTQLLKAKKTISWRDLPKVHVIAVVDFHRNEKDKNGILNDKKVVETYCFCPSISSSNDHLFDQWKATLIDLKKFPDKPLSRLKTGKDKWLYLLKNSAYINEKEADVLKKDRVFGQALERLERLSSDPKNRKAYENSINEQRDHEAILSAAVNAGLEEGARVGLKKGRKEGLEEGLEKGLKMGLEEGIKKGLEEGFEKARKEKIEIAKALLKQLRSLQKIAKITGLSVKDIQALKS